MAGGAMGPAGTVLAESWKRIVALLIDSIGLAIVIGIPVGIISGASSWGTSYDFDAMWLVGYVVPPVIYYLYYALLIGTRGQTVAGMILKIKVVDQNGGPVTQAAAWKRQAWDLLALIPCLGALARLVLAIWGLVNLFNDPMRQTPWDKFGETIVVDA
jgi:uncharacterized RDD family membrane protein YckC